MICRQISGASCKTHLLVSGKTREAVLVDPLLERVSDYLKLLKDEGLRLTHVIDTHTHADHLSGAAELRDKTGAPYAMHAESRASRVTQKVQDGETLGVGDIRITFLHTPGHTRDSLSLRLNDRILSGDFLFIGSFGAGRLDLPGSDPGTHFDSLKKFDDLPDNLIVMPAHDYQGLEQSTIGAERKANPVLSPRNREAYIRWWSDKKFGPADWMKAVVQANLKGAHDLNAVRIPDQAAACACAPETTSGTDLPQISPQDLAKNIARNPKYAFLLDVRTSEEYNDELGHIAGTKLIPIDELAERLGEVPPGEVVVICRSGKRASRGAKLIQDSGRDKVWVLTGGMLAWNEAKLPTT